MKTLSGLKLSEFGGGGGGGGEQEVDPVSPGPPKPACAQSGAAEAAGCLQPLHCNPREESILERVRKITERSCS